MKKLFLLISLIGLPCHARNIDLEIVNITGFYPSVAQWSQAKALLNKPMITVDYSVLTNNHRIMSSIWYLKEHGYEQTLNLMISYNSLIVFSDIPFEEDVRIIRDRKYRKVYLLNIKYTQLKGKELAQVILDKIILDNLK